MCDLGRKIILLHVPLMHFILFAHTSAKYETNPIEKVAPYQFLSDNDGKGKEAKTRL